MWGCAMEQAREKGGGVLEVLHAQIRMHALFRNHHYMDVVTTSLNLHKKEAVVRVYLAV